MRRPRNFAWLRAVVVVLLGAAYGIFSDWAAIELQTKPDSTGSLPSPPRVKFWDFGTTVLPWYAAPASICVRLKWGAVITRQGYMWAGLNETPFYLASALMGVISASLLYALFHLGKRLFAKWLKKSPTNSPNS